MQLLVYNFNKDYSIKNDCWKKAFVNNHNSEAISCEQPKLVNFRGNWHRDIDKMRFTHIIVNSAVIFQSLFSQVDHQAQLQNSGNWTWNWCSSTCSSSTCSTGSSSPLLLFIWFQAFVLPVPKSWPQTCQRPGGLLWWILLSHLVLCDLCEWITLAIFVSVTKVIKPGLLLWILGDILILWPKTVLSHTR